MRGDWLSDPMGGIPGDLAEQEGIGPSPILRAPELRPRAPKDFLLAPVAAAIDQNLKRFRDLTLDELKTEFDSPEARLGRDARAAAVLEAALRDVNMHRWSAEITDDGVRLRLSGGSVALDLGLSATLMHYIQDAT